MNIDNDEQFKQFASSQDVFNAYKQYMALDDMTMVEFAKIVYPLLTAQRQALQDEVEKAIPKMLTEELYEEIKVKYPELDKTDYFHFGLDKAAEAISTIFEGKRNSDF